MADEFTCWVAVVGLPSFSSKENIGPGKSCLCNRFMRSKEDEYSDYHPSGVSNQDFCGQIINNENFLYWGYTKRTFDNCNWGLRIIEHTQFYDDSNFKAFGGSETYLKRALNPKINTHGPKYQYIDYDQLAFGDKDSRSEKFPCEKAEKVVIDAYIYVFDVSREDVHFVEQYNMFESFVKGVKKPLVLVLSKYDEMQCKHIDAIKNLTIRNKAPVVEISSHDNININLVFHLAAKLAKQGNKSTLKNFVTPSYEESFKILKEKRTEVSRMFNTLTEKSVIDKNVTWFEFMQFCKENKHFQNYCELYGTKKAKSILDRHIRNLTIKLNEKRKNLYLKDLKTVFGHFIGSLNLADHKVAIQFIRNHPDFNEYFVALSDEKSWKDMGVQHSPETNRILIPLDLLHEQEAIICFDHRIAKLQEEQDEIDLADEFERSLTQANNILPGLSLDDVLNCVDEKFSKLNRAKSKSIYNDHQLVIAKQYEKELEEMLLENTDLFRMQLPGGDLKPDALQSLTNGLKEDVRWTNFCHMESKRDCLLLQHLAVIVKGTRNQMELSSVEKRYKSVIVEKTMARKELGYSNTLNVGDEEVAVIVMSGCTDTAQRWADKISQECSEVTVDDVSYTVAVTARDPDNVEIFPDFPIHLIIGVYRTDDWDSFRTITRSFDRIQKSYRGLPCQIVYIPSDNQTVTEEEGSRFAHRLNCELISEDTLQETISSVLTSNIALIQTRSEFIETPSSANKTVLNLTIRMLYDDDTSLKELTNSLFKFQYCFVHPYEPGVFVLHTLLNGVPVFVMVHLLHYLDKESYTEHGCVLVCKDSRRASLENARYYMTENNVSRSLGLVVVQTPNSLSYTSAITQTAIDLGIQYTMLEQEQANRRVSIGQHTTAVDMLLLHVLQHSVQFVGDTPLDLSLEVDTSEDEGSFNDLSIKGGMQRHRSHTLDRLGFASPPPHGPYGSLPEKFKSLSVSWNELRDDGIANHSWSSMPRNMKEKVSLDKTPPIYSIVNKNRQRASSSFDNLESGPKSPPIPPRPDRNFSETSSEGPDDNQNKTGGLVTHSLSDSPFKPKRIPKAFKQSKKLTEEEVEQKKLEKKKREENKIKKREDKEERKRKAREQKQLEKNKKMLASWDPKRDISNTKSFKQQPSIADYHKVVESCYFGRSLEEIAPWGGVPYYASLCVEYLECHDLTIEGLYRKEGNKLQINQLEATFEMAFSGEEESLSGFNLVELDVSVHVVASSIKKFLKRLPTPVIPHEFHDLLLAAVAKPSTEVGNLEATANADHVVRSLVKVQEILNTFVKQRKLTLAYIIRHLSRIAELKDQNKMSAFNLAIIFWPTLLQPTQDVLMKNDDRTKFSNMVEFLIDNSDSLFGPELPSCPPPDEEDIYDMVFHPELVKQKTQEEYEYIKRPKTYFNQALRVGHVPSLVKQIVTFIEHGRITTSLYVHTARSDLVDNFVKTYEAAYAVDEHRSLNLRKVLKNLTITRSPTDDSISASTTTDENSVSSTSGDLSDSRFGVFEEQTMDCTILATVLKRYLASLIIPMIPAEHHVNFLEIATVGEESRGAKIRDCFDELKTSHKILLSYLMKHLSLMRDKGVGQLEETFAPILFYGNTDLCSTNLTDLTEPTSPVPITYSPNMVQQQRCIRYLLENVHVYALKDGISLYAPLYETMEQDMNSPSSHQYSSVHYSLPVLPEETRHYDLPSDVPHYIDPLYSSISNTYTRDPALRSPITGPQYADPDDLSELYEEDPTISPNTNTYVDAVPLVIRANNSDVLPNR
ncbi:rho GTPase-activating protein 35-like isoform X5 [Bolinopsis microptera]|uniref:rho GTPase-activating protein 35-like isoform X5 n=1 Tax=Bolinopsis microptera TaxID=2820187 RepID=UPI00307911FC